MTYWRMLVGGLTSLVVLAASAAQTPSLERIVTLPSLIGTAPDAPVWSPDSTRVAFLWNDGGMPFRDVWVVDADGRNLQRLTRLAPESSPPPEAGQTREAMLERSARRHDRGVAQIVWLPDASGVAFVHDGRMQHAPLAGESVRPLLSGDSHGHSPVFSPEGDRVAFVRDNDLWLHDFGTAATERLTDMGQGGIGTVPVGAFIGPDRSIRAHAWSAEGRYLAFVDVDRSDVRRVPIPAWLHDEEPTLHEVRRAYPGDRNERQRVGVFDTRAGELRWLDTGAADERLIYELSWAPDAPSLLIHQGADVAETRWIHVADAATGEVRTVHEDHRPRRIYPPFRAVWGEAGRSIVFLGDHENYYRLYRVPAEGGAVQAVTTGDYDVAASRSAPYLASVGRALFFVAARPTPYERHLFRIEPGGSGAVRVTSRAGTHQPVVSPDGAHFASVMSSDDHPAELYLGDTAGGNESTRVTTSPIEAFADYDWIEPRYVSFPGPDGERMLHARIVEPRNLRPGHRYPVLIGNIYSNTVRNAWDAERPTTNLQQRLALSGEYIHVQVDLRGSIGYGVEFREAFQGDWGRGDLEDLVALADYLATLDHVDPERIGLWGNSYGGLMVLSALFREPGRFAAGVAGAPAVDVHHFTGYDQHLTRRPDTHPAIFEEGSLLDLGEDLADPLMIIHGMHDDIVPFKTTLMMTEKLMLLGKEFDLVAMPRAPHWWAGTEHYALYTFGKLEAFFRRHVPPGPRRVDDGGDGQ